MSAEVWHHVKKFAVNYHKRELLDSTPRMLERYYTFYRLYQQLALPGALALWQADCYFGVVGILLNAVPAVEFEEGLAAAQGVYQLAVRMLQGKEGPAQRAGWAVPAGPLGSWLPFLLGLRRTGCFGADLRVYVYDTGAYSAGSVFCSAGQWGVEVALHRFFASSSCRTLDAGEADLFLVPDYRACHFHLAPSPQKPLLLGSEPGARGSAIIPDLAAKYRDPSEANELFLSLLAKLEHLPGRRGLDHVFIFSDQGFLVNFTHTFPDWRREIPHSIFLSTEAFTPGCGGSCFSPWKDIVLPGHLDQERLQGFRDKNLPTSERTLLFNFHGNVPGSHKYYDGNEVRSSILQFEFMANVSVGGFVKEYFDVMGASHFCLVPAGTSSWTNHLYESFFAGCIPLILSDKFVLPFQDLIPWETLSIRWPQDQVDARLYDYLLELATHRRGVVEEMKRRVDAAACWFDYHNFDSECSPYSGVVKALERRKRSMPRYLSPSHWIW